MCIGEKPNLVDTLPTWRVRLDPVQYQTDLDHLKTEQMRAEVLRSKVIRAKREGRTTEEIQALQAQVDEAEQVSPEDLYDTFNVLIRRKPKENNFKAVLETIRSVFISFLYLAAQNISTCSKIQSWDSVVESQVIYPLIYRLTFTYY